MLASAILQRDLNAGNHLVTDVDYNVREVVQTSPALTTSTTVAVVVKLAEVQETKSIIIMLSMLEISLHFFLLSNKYFSQILLKIVINLVHQIL